MKLIPRRPPGRATRKARTFHLEIVRLYQEGHSCEAIREALADSGLVVSKSTVHRELVRRGHPARADDAPAAAPEAVPTPAAGRAVVPSVANDPRSGKEIAEAFMKGRINNPLIRARSRHEDCRH